LRLRLSWLNRFDFVVPRVFLAPHAKHPRYFLGSVGPGC
jgi:hypothetical protein